MTRRYSVTCPPSANDMWQRTRNGFALSKAYKQWLTTAGLELNIQRAKPIKGPVSISIKAPANGRRDLDNHAKPVCDLLVAQKIIDGDRYKTVKAINLSWHDLPAMLIEITAPEAVGLQDGWSCP